MLTIQYLGGERKKKSKKELKKNNKIGVFSAGMVFIMVKCFDFKRLRWEFVVRGSVFGVRFFTADSTDVAKLSGGVNKLFRSFTDKGGGILDRIYGIDRINKRKTGF